MNNKLFQSIIKAGTAAACAVPALIPAQANNGDAHKSADAPNRPNIVMLFVDDMGWMDLGYQDKTLHTPNIDALKEQGMYFSRAYVSTATSSPSRASLYTGKEAVRCGFVRHIPDNPDRVPYHYWTTDPGDMPSRNWLRHEEITYAERLRDMGYYNHFIGKWHLGHDAYFPIRHGWDSQYGTGEHGHPKHYIAPFFGEGNPLPEFKDNEYLTDVLTDEAVRFIKAQDKKQPFMLNFAYYTVHGPHQGRPDLVAKYKKEGLTKAYAQFAAMVTALDESVGRVRKALKDAGLDKNTVIIFSSDQGSAFDNSPLRGGKLGGETLCEGGSRVPLIIFDPSRKNAGQTCDTPVMTYDLYPTILELADNAPCHDKQIDGVSLVPILDNKKIADRDLFMIRSYEDQNDAIINGDWKMIKYRSGKLELYNLADDIGEKNNLVEEKPELAKSMLVRLQRWEREAIPEDLLRNQHDRANWGGPNEKARAKNAGKVRKPFPRTRK